MTLRTPLLVFLAVVLATSASADPLRLQLFSGVDREAVEVGGLVQINVEAIAVPESDAAARALEDAFGSWDVQSQLGDAFQVVRSSDPMSRETGGVIEYQRRVMVRVLRRVLEVPALRLEVEVGARTWTHDTRPSPLETFEGWEPARSAAESVVSITAEGELDGIPFERVGSAFAVGGDALVTAYHVVVGARRVRVTLPDGREVRISRAWSLDPSRDVAILHLDPSRAQDAGLRPLVVAPHESSGDVAFTAGWPNREQRQSVAPRYADLALDGHRLRVSGNTVLPGDSGGPLLDEDGRVLGVVVSGRGTGGAPDLLTESICIASDLGPALAQYQSADGPVRLSRALRWAGRSLPAARAHEAAGAIQIPIRRSDDDRRVHVSLL
ncbi:trypsin-like peptidase domain-containing protein, partial [Rubrivirga sp.]|uniref:S1 family peptidase n=1 Tax=Rubrivirga sp. TaxID=1885344 RepID=UPI003C72B5F6